MHGVKHPGVKEPATEPLEGHHRYQKVRDINRGSYGFVQLAKDKFTGEEVAVKFTERGDKITKYVEREIINHSNLLHPHIVQFKEVFLTHDYLAIAMEYAAGGDMFQHVKQKRGLQEFEARWFFQQLVIGLDYCHKMGVVNRDIKLENTLLDSSRRPLLKICDFGYSKHQKDSLPKSKVGTPGYTAPEIISNSRHYDGKLVDVWSAGVMLYVMLFCQYPFERADDVSDQHDRFQRVLQRIIRVDYCFPSDVPVSDACKDLLSSILVADPRRRLHIHHIQQHPWYLTDLPPGLNDFNNSCLQQQRARQNTMQNAEAIRAIIREAKHLHGHIPEPIEDDIDYIDDYTDSAMAQANSSTWLQS